MEESLRYRCENQVRANTLRAMPDPPVNGIDYLEVASMIPPQVVGDDEAAITAKKILGQRTLLVHLFSTNDIPADLTGLISITGGVRTFVKVQWAFLAANATAFAAADPPGRISAEEIPLYEGLDDADRVIVVRTDSSGDLSPYRLRLHGLGNDSVLLAGFDPVLSEVEFSFKVECPSEFDCRTTAECIDEVPPTPSIDYLAKDYSSFRQLMLDRMAVTNPKWKERHVPDLQLALVELMAYAADRLSYFQDSVASEAYLSTARRRTSVRRHARLLNYAMHDGCNARAWLHIGVDAPLELRVDPDSDLAAHQEFTLSTAPIRFLPETPGFGIVVAQEELDRFISEHPSAPVFELRTDATLAPEHNEIGIHTWGAEECCLPKGATWADLVDNGFALQAGDFLLLEEVRGTHAENAEEAPAPADPERRQVVRITHVDEPIPDLLVLNEDDEPVITRRVHWHEHDALAFPLCLSFKADGGEVIPDVSFARGNMVLVDHGRTIAREELAERDLSSDRPYRPTLNERGLTFWEIPNETGTITADQTLSASAVIKQEPRAATPSIQLEGDRKVWEPRRDLLESDRFDTHFVAELESDGIVYLRFGDDTYGLEPGENTFTNDPAGPIANGADYRIGNGLAGNLGADSLQHIVGEGDAVITRIYQPLSASGGTDPESLEEVRQYAPQAFRQQQRAVTEADYSARTEAYPDRETPDVQRAATTRRWTGSWYTMFVTADRRDGAPVDAEFESLLVDHLEGYRLTGHDVEVDAPRYVPLDIRMSVCVEPDHFASDVKQRLLQVFSSGTTSSGEKGFFHPDNFTFGQPVYLSRVIAKAMSVEGVKWVDFLATGYDHRFRRWGRAAANEIGDGFIPIGRLEIAQLDNDPSRPENGSMVFYMH